MTNYYTGTAGWSYADWKNNFYPKEWNPASKRLQFYGQHFDTAEVNVTFYRQIEEENIINWLQATPDDFRFSLKLHRYISHTKRLKYDEHSAARFDSFLPNLESLKQKAGPILIQCPPSMKYNLDRLKTWFQSIPKYKYAIEFRNESWFREDVYQVLSDYGVALVYSDCIEWKSVFMPTTDFFYMRLHGPKEYYKSKYKEQELEKLMKKVQKECSFGNEVYTYFNNTYKAFATENASFWRTLLNKK